MDTHAGGKVLSGLFILFLSFLFFSIIQTFLACSVFEEDPTPTPTPTSTPTATYTPTPTRTPSPRSQPFISNVWPQHYEVAEAVAGMQYYTDNTAALTEIPGWLNHEQCIRTSLADEDVDAFPYISFTVDRPVNVYIAYDTAIENMPNWVQVFEKMEGHFCTISTPVNRRFQVMQLPFPAGVVQLGANGCWGALGDPKTFLIFIKGNDGEFNYPGPRRLPYLDYHGVFREWYCQFPPYFIPDGQTPLLYYFQGSQGAYDYIGKTVETTGLIEECLQREFILLAPEIADWIWSGTADYDYDYTDADFVNDIHRFSDYFFPHHPDKVYAAGFSSGAFFANLVALLPPRFCEAIVPFSGGIPNNSSIWPRAGDSVFRIMFMVGSYDTDSIQEAVQRGYYAYQVAGYPVEKYVIPYWQHAWDPAENERIFNFFLQQ